MKKFVLKAKSTPRYRIWAPTRTLPFFLFRFPSRCLLIVSYLDDLHVEGQPNGGRELLEEERLHLQPVQLLRRPPQTEDVSVPDHLSPNIGALVEKRMELLQRRLILLVLLVVREGLVLPVPVLGLRRDANAQAGLDPSELSELDLARHVCRMFSRVGQTGC